MVEETIMEKVEEKAEEKTVEKPTAREYHKFFDQKNCDRCGNELTARITSWFNTDTICMDCSAKEDEIKEKLKAKGKNPSDYEGCGYIPKKI